MKWVLANYSQPEDTILDPFMGSGTTFVAAKELGRRTIGIDKSKKYCDIAIEGVKQECLKPSDQWYKLLLVGNPGDRVILTPSERETKEG
jgi:DNA modification methylase